MHLALADVEVDAVDGADPAEGQHDAAQRHGLRRATLADQGLQRRGIRADVAVLRQRQAVAAIEQRGDAARDGKDDDQQQRRVEEGGPGRERCRNLRQQRQQDGAEQRPEDGAAPADQHRDEEEQRQLEGEGIRRDVGLQRGKQPAGEGRERAGQDEDQHQHARLVDAGGLGRDFRIADRHQRPAEAAMRDIGRRPGADDGDREAEAVKAPGGIHRRRQRRAGDADAAPRHVLPGQGDLGDDGGEAERRHGEVEGPQPQRRQADDDAEEGPGHGGDAERGEGPDRRHHRASGQHAGGIGADGQQRDIADGELPGIADDQVQPGDQDPVDRRPRGDQRPVFIARERQQRGERQQQGEWP